MTIKRWLLILVAVLAIVWAVVRAWVQSITLDEADTYFWFASRAARYIWYPFPNNHTLNTLLIWITTHLFGTSSLTVRAPALLGAVLYVFTCYFLCRSITNHFSIQFPLLICLIYNPFIFDFMAAARGYSLANAFLLASIAIPVWRHVKGSPSLSRCCALASLALGLSFTANFSFAFVDLAAFLVIAAWAIRRRETESVVRIAGWCVLPGLIVVLLLCGYPLAHWPKGELWYGAHSLTEMTQNLIQSSLYRLNRHFLGTGLEAATNLATPWLPPLLLILCLCQLVATRIDGSWIQDARARWVGRFGIMVAAVLALSVLISLLAFRFDKLPLPMGRTGIYLITFSTLVAGVVAAAPARSLVSKWLGRAVTAVFICMACYFLLCLRVRYFKEYEWDADVKDVYFVLAGLNKKYGATDVAVDGIYLSSLNFYRVVSKKESFPEFQYVPPHRFPSGKSIYVLHDPFDRDVIEREGLAVIYRGQSTEVVVAVKPGGRIPAIMIER